MKKLIIFFIIIALFLTGCSYTEPGNINVLMKPNNNKLEIKGTWQVVDNEDKKLYFDINYVNVEGHKYNDVHYKLKIVDSDYVLSYEHDIKISDFISKEEKLDIYSIFSKDKLVGEIILVGKDKALYTYNQSILYITKVSDEVVISSTNEQSENEEDKSYIYENSTGVMIALKNKIGENTSYRTLWIPYYDKKLASIYELQDITFPMKDGIYKIKPKKSIVNGYMVDEFELLTPDKKSIAAPIDYTYLNRYRDITFICNDYIGIEEKTVDKANGEETKLKILPIRNINSTYGVSVQELYGETILYDFKEDINQVNNELKNLDTTDITLYRDKGKWNLYTKAQIDGEDELVELSIKPNNKLVTYDTLTIPWKSLKAEFPLMEDAFISPAEDIAIIVLEDSIGVYKITDGAIENSPLFNIPISKNEEVIMAEWCTGIYTKYWEMSFLAGKKLN